MEWSSGGASSGRGAAVARAAAAAATVGAALDGGRGMLSPPTSGGDASSASSTPSSPPPASPFAPRPGTAPPMPARLLFEENNPFYAADAAARRLEWSRALKRLAQSLAAGSRPPPGRRRAVAGSAGGSPSRVLDGEASAVDSESAAGRAAEGTAAGVGLGVSVGAVATDGGLPVGRTATGVGGGSYFPPRQVAGGGLSAGAEERIMRKLGSIVKQASAASHCTSAAFCRPLYFRELRTTGLQMSSYVSPDAWILCKAMSSV